MEPKLTDEQKIQVENLKPYVSESDSADDELDDAGDRFIDITNELSEEIIFKNIEDQFTSPELNPINYISKYIENYDRLINDDRYHIDKDMLRQSVQKLGSIVLEGMNTYFGVALTDVAGDETYSGDDKSFLKNLDTLYEFFVCRRIENIEEYFKSRINLNKEDLILKYKAILQSSDRDDVIFQANKKKYGNIKYGIFIHFVNEFIADVKSSSTDGLQLLQDFVSLDEFEDYNERMKALLDDFGNSFAFTGTSEKTASKYLAILKDESYAMMLRNYIMDAFTEAEKPETGDGKKLILPDDK